MTDLQSDPRFQGRFAWEVTPEEYDTVRSTWLKHVGAEEKLFVPHSEEEGEQQLEIVRSTVTDDCIYEIKATGERWEGWDGALQFYGRFLAAFSGMQWVPQTVVIGPQGILDVADMTATLEAPFGGIENVGEQVRLEWVIYFPWNPDQKKFEGETFYSIRPLPASEVTGFPSAPEIEDDLDVAFAARRARGRYRLPVLPPAGSADPTILSSLISGAMRSASSKLLHPLSPVLLDAVGVGPREAHLLVPERGEVQAALRARHPDERHLPPGARQAHRVLYRPRGADALEDLVCPAHHDRLAELGPVCLRAQHTGKRPVRLLRMHDLVGPEPQRLLSLPLVLGDADDAARFGELPQGRDGEEADAARPDHERRLVRPRVRLQRRVHRAGEGLYRDGRLVRDAVWDAVELRGVGDERAPRPSPSRVAAEAGLDARAYVALGDVHAQGVAAGGAVDARQLYAAHGAPKRRLHHDPLPGRKAGVVLGDHAERPRGP